MTRIGFDRFFGACKDRLTDDQIRVLDPFDLYLEADGSYFGIRGDQKRLWISIMVGGVRGMWAVRDLALKAGVEQVGWLCREGRVLRIAKFWDAAIEDSGEKYQDGATAWRCIIDTRQTRRHNKSNEKKQALI